MDSWKGAFFEQGRQSIKIPVPVYIRASASIAGSKEGDGPLGDLFDMVGVDDKFGSNTWEEAESTLQKETLQLAIGKAGLSGEDIRFLLAGDLLAQSMASSFGLASFQIPLIGLYGACSTCGLSLAMAAALIVGGMAQYVASVTSSHFASAEKEFRYPLGYGNQRPLSATWTVTGSGAFILSSLKGKKDRAVITGLTIGKIVDLGMKDSMNMGACMAPAASSLICQHFADFGRTPEDYDQIITGDLGLVGQRVLLDMLAEKGFDLSGKHMDCGIEIYDEKQDAHAGGSGCGCSAVVLSALILKKLEEGEWKRVLFVPTGALLSKTSFNEGKSIPGIAHALVLERCS
ncbi:stage V sporulation protein AD [Suilimivivens aceti]|uniref:Stage V sporulation protein AD n=1 Tax=Suilimivivens aceti TaxID=2981774 RepID=A0ABT2T0K9_9FIRM|nr:stage V sporulation protein AD [Suilimivivens aceti]MCU6743790.1 stage V sporulation protein AD [Suilimivivens aceti]SCH38317.1 Stage V sporulation protein AD [uncultured Clostridium sp.]